MAVLVVVVRGAGGPVVDVRQGERVLVLENDVDVLGGSPTQSTSLVMPRWWLRCEAAVISAARVAEDDIS